MSVSYAVSANGNRQSKKRPEQQLFEIVVGSLYGSGTFYEKADHVVKRMKVALDNVIREHGEAGARFALNVARLARDEMYIRTLPHVMTVELARVMRERNIQLDKFKDAVAYLIQRADELSLIYSYALDVFKDKQKVPLALKKGVAQAFNKFDAYQFAKYNRRSNAIAFRDLMRIVHPVPADPEHGVIFSGLMTDTLPSANTWEVALTVNGQLPPEQRRSKKDLWTELIQRTGQGELGYMGLLRNLRNFKEAEIEDQTWEIVAARIEDPVAVQKAKQLPFAYINAHDTAVLHDLPKRVRTAITAAAEQAVQNVPRLGQRVWIILDCSGSMTMGDPNVTNTPMKVGAIFASSLLKASRDAFDFKFTMFSDHAQHVNLAPQDSIFTLYETIMNKVYGGGTNLQAALNLKPTLGFEPDAVVVISDMEVDQLESKNISKMFTPDCVKVALNLSSGESTPCGERDGWIQLAGWSDRVFQFVDFTRSSEQIVDRLMEISR